MRAGITIITPSRRRVESTSIDWRQALLDPVYFSQVVLGITPHPGQKAWLRRSTKGSNLLATGNRWGKSYVQAIKILHRAIFRIRDMANDGDGHYNIVAASITQDQANIIFNAAVRMVRMNTLLSPLLKSVVRSPYPKAIFGNDSVITARTTQNRGHYLLGNDYDFFSFDEAAFEGDPEYVINDVIMMRLTDRNGSLDLISTPNGKNWFYRKMLELQKSGDDGYVQFGDSRDNPHLSDLALKSRLRNLPADRVEQNIAGKFIDNDLAIFSSGDIDQALTDDTLSSYLVDHKYISGWDLARKQTHTVGMTFDVTTKPYRLVSIDRFNNRDWSDVLQVIRQRQKEYSSKLVVDATGLGDVVVSELSDLKAEGVIFTPRTKSDLLGNLLLLHNRKEIQYCDYTQRDESGRTWSLETEMREVMWENNNIYDAVMAMALALWPKRSRILFPVSGPVPVRVSRL